jgi:hypothetical protein
MSTGRTGIDVKITGLERAAAAAFTQPSWKHSGVAARAHMAPATTGAQAGQLPGLICRRRGSGTAGCASGLVLLAVTGLLFALATSRPAAPVPLVAGMATFGLGMGASFVAGSVASLAGTAEQDAGVAAALQAISFALGTTLGAIVIALAGLVATLAVRARE